MTLLVSKLRSAKRWRIPMQVRRILRIMNRKRLSLSETKFMKVIIEVEAVARSTSVDDLQYSHFYIATYQKFSQRCDLLFMELNDAEMQALRSSRQQNTKSKSPARESNPESSAPEADALSIGPTRHSLLWKITKYKDLKIKTLRWLSMYYF